jgi:hypothetical protein
MCLTAMNLSYCCSSRNIVKGTDLSQNLAGKDWVDSAKLSCSMRLKDLRYVVRLVEISKGYEDVILVDVKEEIEVEVDVILVDEDEGEDEVTTEDNVEVDVILADEVKVES